MTPLCRCRSFAPWKDRSKEKGDFFLWMYWLVSGLKSSPQKAKSGHSKQGKICLSDFPSLTNPGLANILDLAVLPSLGGFGWLVREGERSHMGLGISYATTLYKKNLTHKSREPASLLLFSNKRLGG